MYRLSAIIPIAGPYLLSASQYTNSCPLYTVSQPAYQQLAPIYSQSASISTVVPLYTLSQQVYQQLSPIYSQSASIPIAGPLFTLSQPVYQQLSLMYRQSASIPIAGPCILSASQYTNSWPLYTLSQPVYQQLPLMYRQSASISTVVPLFTLSQPVFQQFSKSISTKLILLHQPEVWARLLRGAGCAYVQPPATSLYFSSHNRAFTAPYLLQERGISPHPFQSLKREIAARDDVRVASASSVRPPPTREREREGETERSVPTHTHTQTHTGLSGNSELRHHRHGRLRRHRQTLRRELCALGLKLTVTEPAYGTAMIVYGSEITVSKRVPGECVRVHYACVPCVSKVRVWRERCRGRLPIMAADQPAIHGHSFAKKTFHKPTYCHHCSDMLWGLIQQGYICEGFLVPEIELGLLVSGIKPGSISPRLEQGFPVIKTEHSIKDITRVHCTWD
uniref:Phorbol-ester/DAG-type domain-containing protein n=1 Tax=Timema cristinae TaxID=61476 RepID=A0A7R9C9Q9_TIMCR|nr:unnamed protein product [Timema cristinae]